MNLRQIVGLAINIGYGCSQGVLTKVEGSVRLNSLYYFPLAA